MPLTKSTRNVIFVNTSEPKQRVQLLKSNSALQELPESSTDIMANNIVKRYARRPKCLNNWCLADYVSRLEIVYPKEHISDDSCDQDINDDDYDEETTADELFNDDKTIVVLKNGIKIRKRQTGQIIRYVRFNKKSDEENHFREKLLLFLPWRNEDTDLLADHSTYKNHYLNRKNEVDMKCKFYEHHTDELEMARQAAENECHSYDDIVPGTEQIEAEAEAEGSAEADRFVYFNPD